MLEKPDISEERIAACLREDFGRTAPEITFLPLGADINSAQYRAAAEDGSRYFVKLRRGIFEETSVLLPKYMSDQGIKQIIAPIPALSGRLWANFSDYTLALYPFVEGQNAYHVELTDRQWNDLGIALRRIHNLDLPAEIKSRLPGENYSPRWREVVKSHMARISTHGIDDPVSRKLADFLEVKRDAITTLNLRAEELVAILSKATLDFVVCHSDIHAGNILVGDSGDVFIVDWDNPILAPKERDLMFFGNGQGFSGHSPQEEEILFYEGYGKTPIDQAALAYYRYERIIEDIAAFCDQLLLTDEGGEDREVSLGYLMSNFDPDGTIDLAYRSDGSR